MAGRPLITCVQCGDGPQHRSGNGDVADSVAEEGILVGSLKFAGKIRSVGERARRPKRQLLPSSSISPSLDEAESPAHPWFSVGYARHITSATCPVAAPLFDTPVRSVLTQRLRSRLEQGLSASFQASTAGAIRCRLPVQPVRSSGHFARRRVCALRPKVFDSPSRSRVAMQVHGPTVIWRAAGVS